MNKRAVASMVNLSARCAFLKVIVYRKYRVKREGKVEPQALAIEGYRDGSSDTSICMNEILHPQAASLTLPEIIDPFWALNYLQPVRGELSCGPGPRRSHDYLCLCMQGTMILVVQLLVSFNPYRLLCEVQSQS